MSGKRSTGINVGGSSILVIFVLLCLTTFATLSMVSANADYKLTQKASEAVSNYYAADCLAEEKLAQIDGLLAQSYTADADQYYASSAAALATVEGVSVSRAGADMQISYTIPASETQELSVVLTTAHPASAAEPRYVRTAWNIVSTVQHDTEGDTLNLWDGDEDLQLFIP